MTITTYLVPDPNFIGALASASIGISANSLSVTLQNGYSGFQAIGNDPTTTGAYYFEVTIGPNWGGGTAIGILDSLFDPGITGGNTARGITNHAMVLFENGNVYSNGSTVATIPSFTANTTYCVAVDFGAKLIWFQVNGGSWNGTAANPATGSGGISISSLTGPFVPVLAFQGGSGTVTFNFGNTTFAGTAPAGFSNWPLSAPTFGARVSQTGMDSLKDNTSANVRVSYESIESINAQTTANARVSYESVESLVYLDNTNARASQIVLQVLTPVFVPMTGAHTNTMIVT